MAEPTKPILAFTFDESKVKAKIKEVRDYMQGFVGRAGYNSYVWINKNLTPLEEKFNKEDRSKELFDAFMNLKLAEPLASGAEHNAVNPPKEHAAAGNSSNAGQVHMASSQPSQKVN